MGDITPDRNFELGLDSKPDVSKFTSREPTYSREAVMLYRVNKLDDILENPSILGRMIQHHKTHQVPRLTTLEDYYLGLNPGIMTGKRRTEEGKSDHRIRHSWASIISDFINSYVLTNPIKIDQKNDEKKKEKNLFLDVVENFNELNDIDSHNIELGKDQNNFGRAFELLQRTKKDNERIYRLDPRQVFMIYDETVRTRVIGACRYYPVNMFDSFENLWRVELYSFDKIYKFMPINIDTSHDLKRDEGQDEEHSFNGVPIIEYRSDRYRMGVFEKQISGIDAYDAAQSDTANYMSDFNDAILAIEGRIQNADDPGYFKKMKDANTLILIPEEGDMGESRGGIKAHYLTKSYDVAGTEAYKSRIKQDIFSGASVPDLSDDAFAGQQSGEALKYKMFGLQQKRNDKEKFFAKGLRIRYKLLENIKRKVSEYTEKDEPELTFKFTANLPKAFLEELKAFRDSGGEISNESMLALLSFVEDVKEELDRLQKEKGEVTDPFDTTFGLGDDHGHNEEPAENEPSSTKG